VPHIERFNCQGNKGKIWQIYNLRKEKCLEKSVIVNCEDCKRCEAQTTIFKNESPMLNSARLSIGNIICRLLREGRYVHFNRNWTNIRQGREEEFTFCMRHG